MTNILDGLLSFQTRRSKARGQEQQGLNPVDIFQLLRANPEARSLKVFICGEDNCMQQETLGAAPPLALRAPLRLPQSVKEICMSKLCYKCAFAIMRESWPATNNAESEMPDPPELLDGRCPVCNSDRILVSGDLAGFWDHLL